MPGSSIDLGLDAHPIGTTIRAAYAGIEAASSPKALVPVCAALRREAVALYAEGLRSDVLTGIVAQWNDAVLRRLLALHAEALAGLRWCWLALGSEGRLEQTLVTDQDNALIFDAPAAGAVRDRLLPVLRSINEWLDRCGYAWCKGGVMASNPQWCLSVTEWQDAFAGWIDTGAPEALLHGAIFFDFRGIGGDRALVHKLRRWLTDYIRPRPLFLQMLAAQTLDNHPPLTPWRSLRGRRVEGRKVLDVKINGVSLFVDTARIVALDRGVDATSTVERLRQAAQSAEEVANTRAWIGAYHCLQDLRIRHQFDQLSAGRPADNRLELAALSRFDHRQLVAALLEARRAQDSLRIRYQL